MNHVKTELTEIVNKNQYRTHSCGELRADHVGEQVTLSGWVHSRRDHGGLIFIDLRGKSGITQLSFDPSKNETAHKLAESLRSEFVIKATGEVVARPPDMVNSNLDTGEIEIAVSELEILSESKTPPFPVADDAGAEVNEELRLQYRFLDLRHPRMQSIMKTKNEFFRSIRDYMKEQGFTEIQTPILANTSPEGARDFLIPSRLYPGKFYALPQAPQQFKQLLMVSGLDRYFQIAPCFRDEDPRADRHAGSFYQIDLEMAFAEQEDVFSVVEPLMIKLTEEFTDKKIITTPFPKIPWKEAMTKYGTDKPDLRYQLHISDVTKKIKGTEFSVFEDVIGDGGVVHALHVSGGASFSRKDVDELTEKAKEFGAKGLAYIVLKDGSLNSPILKYLGEEKGSAIAASVGAKDGDAIFFGAGAWLDVCKALGPVRALAANKLELDDPKKAAWAWIVDFPMYERDPDTDKIDFSHNPFSMPQGGLEALESTEDPTEILAYQYDLALNGFEISSGAIRNHRPDIMYKAFELAGYSKEDVDTKFGGMLRAFEYGAPPHGGFAPGVDRLLMVLLDLPNIRDTYAFPKDAKARDLLMDSPSAVDSKQLEDLHIELDLDD